ncbi:MAG: hypothetical protein KAW46_02150 [candidate division Zixibacteria bacterium]|nr:hypothetical protein [candidate division Zixibacteria bacterium]
MVRRLKQQIVTAMVLAIFMVPATFGAKFAPREQIAIPEAAKSTQNVLPMGQSLPTVAGAEVGHQPLGRSQTSSISPGKWIGDTWYDLQHNGSMGRMIDWGWDDTNNVLVHFTWTRMPDYPGSDRRTAYNVYYSVQDSTLGQTFVQSYGDDGGFSNIDAAIDNRAVIAAHVDIGGGSQTCVYWDYAPGFGFFGDVSCIPDSVGSAIWPKFRYHEVPGQTPVTHVFARAHGPGAGDPQALYYFRKVGTNSGGDWDYPPYVVDTVFNIAQDIACSNIDGKMAFAWVASCPEPGDCDTCSSNGGPGFVAWDNDIYYQISYDYGATFAPRVNLTKNVDGEDGYRPYTDLSTLIGADNDFRIGWNGRFWPSDANQGGEAGLDRCRMFYWGENLGNGGFDGGDAIIRSVANLEWDQTTCNGGAWQMNGSKMTLSECDSKLYYLWVQFNDIPNGIEDDCAERAFGSSPDVVGSANGDLYLAVSDDGGFTWDVPRNLTNTYTPHCDSATGPGGRCQSEHFPSMSRIGTNHPLSGSNYVVIDPSGGYTGDYFLDVMYIDDADPGVILQDEGTWQLADVRWFRLPCVEPMPAACLTSSVWGVITHTLLGVELSIPLVLENVCNLDANFTLTIHEINGPEGWLTTSGFESGVVLAGGGQLEGTFTINTGGIVNDPGVVITLLGGLTFEGNFVGSPLEIPIRCDVIPEIYELWPDTIETNCLSLVLLANGSFGNQGVGKVNMDFFDHGDCDTVDSIPGETDVYLYDGSPVICWPDGDSVRCNWSIFGTGPLYANGFLPVSCEEPVDSGDFYFYQSEFITHDSGIGVRQSWYAPKDQPDSCQFLIHRLRVYSNDGQTHYNLAIGEVIDWDIPADTGIQNNSGFDANLRLVYQNGAEYDEDPEECLDNDDRFGGISLVQIMGEGEYPSEEFYGAYTADNATQVYPSGGLDADSVWKYAEYNEGYVIEQTQNIDLHSMMTYRFGHTLQPGDTLDIVSVLATSMGGYADFIAAVQAGHQWSYDHLLPHFSCCVGMRGNIDFDPGDAIDISDLVYLVDYMFTGGPEPPCFEEADVTGDGEIDIEDLICIVDGMFLGFGWDCIADCPPPEEP